MAVEKIPNKAVQALVDAVQESLDEPWEKIVIRPVSEREVSVQAWERGDRDPHGGYAKINPES